jgi:hypothetical protein
MAPTISSNSFLKRHKVAELCSGDVRCFPRYEINSYALFKIILMLKPGKNPNHLTSYRPISLLSTISKLLEKLIYHRINPLIDVIPLHQLGFRHSHSTIQQCCRIVHIINKSFEEKKYCPSVFLGISQAFDKVWHDGFLYKIKHSLPSYLNLFMSSLSDRQLRTAVNGVVSSLLN